MAVNFKESFINFTKACGKVGLCLLAAAAYAKTIKDEQNYPKANCCYGYSDAVKAIMCSNMFDSNKEKAVELLKKDADAEYYKSVANILESDMFDSHKIRAIEKIG